MLALLDAEGNTEKPLTINADQYDLMVNGYESASGAVLNHDLGDRGYGIRDGRIERDECEGQVHLQCSMSLPMVRRSYS